MYLDVTYRIDLDGKYFYKITKLDSEWKNMEINPCELSKVMFNKNIEINTEMK